MSLDKNQVNTFIPSDLQRLIDSIAVLPEINRVTTRHHIDHKLGRFYNYSLFFVIEPDYEDKAEGLDFWQQVSNFMISKEEELRQISSNPYNLNFLILKEEDLSRYS